MYNAYGLFAILVCSMVLFVWGKWRYDLVAIIALITGAITGIIPSQNVFSGFSNMAVITVACVMIISYAITQSGVLQTWIRLLKKFTEKTFIHVGIFAFMSAAISGFINNVGALTLMMPAAIATSMAHKRAPSIILMPLAFSSVLGGLITAIGTPPNLIISAYRKSIIGDSYHFFDFTPVGIVAALSGLLFITLLGWRLMSSDKKSSQSVESLFQLNDYLAEVKINKQADFIGKTLKDVEAYFDDNCFILGLIRGQKKRLSNIDFEVIEPKDVIIIETSPDIIKKLASMKDVEIVGGKESSSEILQSETIGIIEAVVPQGSRMEGRSANSMRLRSRYQLNLIGLSRKGKTLRQSLQTKKLQAGDVVLLQADREHLIEISTNLGFMPLVEFPSTMYTGFKRLIPIISLMLAISTVILNWLPIHIAFATVVMVLILLKVISLKEMYDAVDWSIVVLLAALIPLGQALESTGATHLITDKLIYFSQNWSPIWVIALVMVITMTLSDIMNNAVTAVIMAPISVTIGQALHIHPDPLLMAVAIGASCSFLTPISHQNNTLVMGPGGYTFKDYIRLGLPLEIIVVLSAVPMIMMIWPLN